MDFYYLALLLVAAAPLIPVAMKISTKIILVTVLLSGLIPVAFFDAGFALVCAALSLIGSFLGYWFRDFSESRIQVDELIFLNFGSDSNTPATKPTTPFGQRVWKSYLDIQLLRRNQLSEDHIELLRKLVTSRGRPSIKLARARIKITKATKNIPAFLFVGADLFPFIPGKNVTYSASEVDSHIENILARGELIKLPSPTHQGQLALRDRKTIYMEFWGGLIDLF